MKIIVAVLVAASLMACGGKAKKQSTPDNKTGTTDNTNQTGGTTYGGATTPTPTPASGAPTP
jgi:hypothetical protein